MRPTRTILAIASLLLSLPLAGAAHAGDDRVLIRIESRAGHGAGAPTAKIIERIADQWAFLAHHTGLGLEREVE